MKGEELLCYLNIFVEGFTVRKTPSVVPNLDSVILLLDQFSFFDHVHHCQTSTRDWKCKRVKHHVRIKEYYIASTYASIKKSTVMIHSNNANLTWETVLNLCLRWNDRSFDPKNCLAHKTDLLVVFRSIQQGLLNILTWLFIIQFFHLRW